MKKCLVCIIRKGSKVGDIVSNIVDCNSFDGEHEDWMQSIFDTAREMQLEYNMEKGS
jgi:hypothetical protein